METVNGLFSSCSGQLDLEEDEKEGLALTDECGVDSPANVS